MIDALSAIRRTEFYFSPRSSGSCGRLLVLLTISLFIFPIPSAAQTTQTLSLDAGWNLVSLHVQPDDSSFASIFDGAVSMVKNGDGDVYLPSEEIEQISTWRTGDGYTIYAETATTLDVTGTEISPGKVAIELEDGGNIVPYLSDRAQAVEGALGSIDESLVAIEDEDGDQYVPSASSTPLDSLRPGQGYKVYVDRADTLRYPVVVETLNDALALTGMKVGASVRVRGRVEPGDGGGGLFRVTTSGATTDGGTVFMLDEDLTQVTETFTGTPPGSQTVDLQGSDLSWRTLEVRYGAGSEDVVGALHLNGFHQNKAGQADPWYDLSAGTLELAGFSPLNTWESKLGWDRGGEWDVTYKHTSSNRRLERKIPRETIHNGQSIPMVNPQWWGAPVADPQNPKPADAYIRHAMLKSAEIVQNTGFDWSVVAFDTTFYYQHQIELQTGNYFKGTGPLNADGYTRGGIKGLPGELLDYRLTGFDEFAGDANNREDVYLMYGDLYNPQPTCDKATARFGFEKFKADGNVRNNMQVFNNLGDYNEVPTHLQNSGSWSGFYDTFLNTADPVDGVFRDIRYKDMGGSGLVFGRGSVNKLNVTIDNLNNEDARRNHLLYGMQGSDINDITLEGQFWGSAAPILDPRSTEQTATVTDLTIQNLDSGQFGYDAIVAARGPSGPGGGLTIDGFTLDLTGLSMNYDLDEILKVSDGGNTFKNGTVRSFLTGDYGGNFPTVTIGYRGWNNNVKTPNVLKNIDIYDHGEDLHVYDEEKNGMLDLLVENVTYQMASGVSASNQSPPFYNGTQPRSSPPRVPNRQMRTKHVNTSYLPPVDIPFAWKANNNFSRPFFPSETYHIGGTLNNQSNLVELNQFPNGERAVRLFMDGATVNLNGGSDFHRQLRPEVAEVIRFRNVTDNSGHTSDQVSQSYSATSSDESNGYALIPTSLISRAWETSLTANAGYSVTTVEVANSDGTLRADDNTGQADPYLKVSVNGSITQGDTFTWTARVTPQARYKTSGTFIARRLYNRTSSGVLNPFTSGNGPFTVSLLGVASAQDMDIRAQPTYTASSGSAGVVTASVNADEHTLTLTEQGTGTATITVTGYIPNVGTATTTFDVTIQ